MSNLYWRDCARNIYLNNLPKAIITCRRGCRRNQKCLESCYNSAAVILAAVALAACDRNSCFNRCSTYVSNSHPGTNKNKIRKTCGYVCHGGASIQCVNDCLRRNGNPNMSTECIESCNN